MGKKDLILDSNFLMVLSRSKISETVPVKNLLAHYNLVVPLAVIRELEMMAKGKSAKARNAGTALEIAKSYQKTNEVEGNVDDVILELARKRNATVATLDAELMANLKVIDIPIVTLRRNRLVGLE